MAKVTYNIVAKDLNKTFLVGLYALLSASGRDVEVGPFDDDLMSRVYVWIKGEGEDVDEVLENLKTVLDDKSIEYNVTPYAPSRVKE